MDIISYALSKGNTQKAVTDYLDEHLTNPTNPPIDTSLSIAGAAADAKETGDKITQLKEDLTSVENGLNHVSGISTQIYDKNKTVSGYYYDSSGELVENPAGTWRITEDMSVSDFDYITYSGIVTAGTSPYSVWKLKDNTIVPFKQNSGESKLQVPLNAEYVSFSIQLNDYQNFSVIGTKDGDLLPNVKGNTSLFIGNGAGSENEEPFDYVAAQTNNGCFNTAVGVRAMEKNTTGDHSTAVGFQAMQKTTTGNANTAFGEDALYENTTGGGNVAVGSHALQNSNSDSNVAVGQSALMSQTSGYFNTALGNECGQGGTNAVPVTSDDRLTLIGNRAGKKTNTIISNSIAIGAGALCDASNQCVIGNGNVTEFVLGSYVLLFNQDGTVSWSERT